MAYDVTTEWDDIHRKLGNYEPLPEVTPQEQFVKENILKLEELGEKDKLNKSGSDFDSDDEEFFEEYKRKKLESLQVKSDA